MRAIRTVLFLAAVLGAGSRVAGCQPDRTQEVTERVILQPLQPVELSAGQTAHAVVQVVVAEGFHVQANPAAFDYLIPIRLEVGAVEGLEIGRPVYPPGKPYRLHGSPDTLSVYDGAFEITLPLRAPAAAYPGPYTLRGTLHYQCCDHRTCLPPASKPVVLTVHR